MALLAILGCIAFGAMREQAAVAGRPGATGAATPVVASPVAVEAGSVAGRPSGIGNPAGDLSGFGDRW